MNALAGRTVLVTRSAEQAGELGSLLAERGARVIEAPVITIAEPADWRPADEALGRLDSYDRIVLTSVNAVSRFHARLAHLGLTDSPGNNLIAIGRATAQKMRSLGLTVHAVATDARAEGLLELLLAGGELTGQRILIPRAEVARELLPRRLREAGAVVDVIIVYRTMPCPVPEDVLELLRLRKIDAIAFTSSSTVTNMLAAAGGSALLSGVAVAVIGPVTAMTARESGLTVEIESSSAEMSSLADAIAGYFEKRT